MPYGRAFPCTVSVNVSGLATQGANRPDVVSALVEYFRPAPIAAIQFIGMDAKVTFEREVHKREAMQYKSISVNGVDCEIRWGGPRPQNVLIYNFPYEIEHCVVRNALSFFGEVDSVRFRHWTHHSEVCDGVRTVRMVRSGAIPRNLIIDGFPVKVSYVGQELECDICGKKGHIARNCEMRGKCMECKQPGHFQRNCPVRRQRLSRPDGDDETGPLLIPLLWLRPEARRVLALGFRTSRFLMLGPGLLPGIRMVLAPWLLVLPVPPPGCESGWYRLTGG